MTRFLFSIFFFALVHSFSSNASEGQTKWRGHNPIATVVDGDERFTAWQWVNPLPQGNLLRAMTVLDSTSFIAVGDAGTVVKTTNRGFTWSVQHFAGGSAADIWDVEFISADTAFAVGNQATILRSVDGGENWAKIVEGVGRDQLYAISFYGSSGLAVGDRAGNPMVFRTTDRGLSWIRRDIPGYFVMFGVQMINANLAYAAGTTGAGDTPGLFFRTTNGGLNWDSAALGNDTKCFRVFFQDSLRGIIAGERILKYTTNGGALWTNSSLDFQLAGSYQIWGLRPKPSGMVTCTVGQTGPNPDSIVAIYQSSDLGQSWVRRYVQRLGYPYQEQFSDVDIDSSGFGAAVGWAGRIVFTNDFGLTWFSDTTAVREQLQGVAYFTPQIGLAVAPGLVARTIDGGATWSRILTNGGYGVFCIDTLAAVVVGDGIFRTSNAGETWETVFPIGQAVFNSVSFASKSVGYAVGQYGAIAKTTNKGFTWEVLSSGVVRHLYSVTCIDEDRAVVVGDSCILKTTDRGITWKYYQAVDYLFGVDFAGDSVGIAVGNENVEHGNGVSYRTSNFGQTWVRTSFNSQSHPISISFVDSLTAIAVGNPGSIRRTTDAGVSWSFMNSPTHNNLYSLSVKKSGTGIVIQAVGGAGTVLVSAVSPLNLRTWTWTGLADSLWNRPENWNPQGVPLPGDSVVIQISDHNPIIDSLEQVVVGSLNIRPNSSLTIAPSLIRLGILGDIIIAGALRLLEGASTLIVVGGGWIVESGAPGFIPAGSTVSLRGDGVVSGNFFNITIDSSGAISSSGNLRVENRTNLISDIDLQRLDTIAVANPSEVSLIGPGKLRRGSIQRSINAQQNDRYRFESDSTYVQFSGTGTYPSTVTVTTYPDTNPSAFGMLGGPVHSTIDTVTNTIHADSIPNPNRKWVIVRPPPTEPEFRVHLDSNAVWRVYSISSTGGTNYNVRLSLRYEQSEVRGLPEDSLKLYWLVDSLVNVSDEQKSVPQDFALLQNYPNPFNPTTTIKYQIPVESKITLTIYNILGQRVKTLLDETAIAGYYQQTWNGTNSAGNPVGSGVYFYRIEAVSQRNQGRSFTQVRKLLFLK